MLSRRHELSIHGFGITAYLFVKGRIFLCGAASRVHYCHRDTGSFCRYNDSRLVPFGPKRMNVSFRIRTILGIALIEAILLVILITTVLSHMRQASEASLERYASTTASLFVTATKDAVLSYDLASLESFVQQIIGEEEVGYARVMGSNGQQLAAGGKANLLERPFRADTRADNVMDGYFDIRWPIEEGGQSYGEVQLGISNSAIASQLDETRQMAITIALLEMALVALFSLGLGYYLTRRLKQIQKAAQRISIGDFDHRTEVLGHDEIADVAQAFNHMSEQLKATKAKRDEYQRELESLNRELEARVQRRTRQLSEQNQLLETAYADLQSAQSKLVHAEKLASLGQLSAGIAHEINNPVAFVKTNLGVLQDYLGSYQQFVNQLESVLNNQPLSAHDKQELETARREADLEFMEEDSRQLVKESLSGVERVETIVQGLREYSRSDETTMALEDLNACIESTYRIVANQLKYHCEVCLNLAPLRPFYFNRGKLSQVIMNLLVNAGQAIEGNGRITVTSWREDENWVCVSVDDTGHGIPPENLENLFDPFFTTKPVGQGTGLGLAIAEGIVREHGGRLTVASEVGKGTCFTIHLPVRSDSELADS